MRSRRCLQLAAILSFLRPVSAFSVVADDTNGDPDANLIEFTPQGAWLGGGIGGCPGCQGPNTNMAYEGTWHGSFFNQPDNQSAIIPQALFRFNGTSVQVNGIISDRQQNPNGHTLLGFWLDGKQVGKFIHSPSGSAGYTANVTMFQSTVLPFDLHTLIIQNGVVHGGSSLAIIDSITYSVDEDSVASITDVALTGSAAPTQSLASSSISATRTSHTAQIAGAVVGVLAVLLLVLLAFLILSRRRNQDKSNPLDSVRKFFSSNSTSRSQQDMSPVPFTAGQRVTAPAARTRTRNASDAASSRLSRISFNPNLLVGRRRAPPALPVARPPGAAAPAVSGSPAPPPRASRRDRSAQNSPQPPKDVVKAVHAWQRRTLEATARQGFEHPQEAAALQQPPRPLDTQPVVHPLDMSEVDLSTHYDESSGGPLPAPPPAPPSPRSPLTPQRRFTVMNN